MIGLYVKFRYAQSDTIGIVRDKIRMLPIDLPGELTDGRSDFIPQDYYLIEHADTNIISIIKPIRIKEIIYS